jgi:hypothetical protein
VGITTFFKNGQKGQGILKKGMLTHPPAPTGIHFF